MGCFWGLFTDVLAVCYRPSASFHLPSTRFFSLSRIIYVLLLAAVLSWFVLDTAQRGTRQIVSFFGLLLLVFLMLLFSKHPFRVRHTQNPVSPSHTHTLNNVLFFIVCWTQWSFRTLVWGMGLQFVLALLSFRTTFGLQAVQWAGHQIEVRQISTGVSVQRIKKHLFFCV